MSGKHAKKNLVGHTYIAREKISICDKIQDFLLLVLKAAYWCTQLIC